MDVKYLKDGKEVYVLTKMDKRLPGARRYDKPILISLQQACLDVIYNYNYLQIVDESEVYDEPPTFIYDERIKKLEEREKELMDSIFNLGESKRELEKVAKENQKKYERIDKLKRLNDFIDGKITHYVILSMYTRESIVDFKDAKCMGDKRDLKLLTLFGNSKGELNWKLNQYSDGSGCNSEVIPCTSYEEAVKELEEFIDEEVRNSMDNPRGDVIKMASKYKIGIDPEYIAKYEENEKEAVKKRIEKHIEEIEKLERHGIRGRRK